MLAGMTSSQFTEWMVFMKLENERIEDRHGEKKKPKGGDMEGRLKQVFTDMQTLRDVKKRKVRDGR